MALRSQVVDLIRLDVQDQVGQAAAIRQIAIMQEQSRVRQVRILIEMVDASAIEAAGAPDETVDFVALFEQEFGQITSRPDP